jgi:thiol-disulfide isomerase/thioredoxin
MKTRWTIAVLGVLALTALTITSQMPWLLHDEPKMVEQLSASMSAQGEGGEGGSAALSCPADAKPANLAFTLKDVNGRSVTLADYTGKVILLDFWATWCGPCKVEIPHFIEFQNKYGKNGLQVVGVSVDDTLPKLKPYVAQMKMNYPVLQGLDHEDIQDAYGPLLGIPVTVLISRDAKICLKHAGLHSKDAFENQIKALLGL